MNVVVMMAALTMGQSVDCDAAVGTGGGISVAVDAAVGHTGGGCHAVSGLPRIAPVRKTVKFFRDRKPARTFVRKVVERKPVRSFFRNRKPARRVLGFAFGGRCRR